MLNILANRDAVSHVHDTFLAAAASLASVPGLLASISFQPVTATFLKNGQRRGGPNPQGIDITKAPYFWIVLNVSWENSSDDSAAVSFAETITAQLEGDLASKGVAGTYLYLNDAGPGQLVFESYPKANLARLKTIRFKYDPLKIYTNLLAGGWKVANS